ncbi:MAG: sigma-54 dependent transcriptional regulator [Woeseiaceae bacterium]|nr:sigma-54 dependent transcriptional regulator [Woeseiaceae bacterium]
MTNILVVDDEEDFTSGIATYLRKRDYGVVTANSLSTAREAMADSCPDVLLLDLMLPDGNGLDLLTSFGEQRPSQIILITGHNGIKTLIGDVAGEGVTYMRKPVSPRELSAVLSEARDASDADRSDADPEARFGLFIGESDPMQKVYKQIRQVAESDTTVFVRGESGTGKELVAEAVHRLSGRSGPFIPVNCGALTKDLVSSQLFGHEKGSFTGAQQRHAGFFERASGGTLFLDEITEMPIETQTHLLRVLETGRVLRVGADQEIDIDTRLVVASNRDPTKAIRDGFLREDLYFRISVFPIELPPLRKRGNDIDLLAQHFLRQLNDARGTNKAFTDAALTRLHAHPWPGNVRELRHTVQRCFLLAEDDAIEVQIENEAELTKDISGLAPGRSIADVEKDLILRTLEYFDGDKKATAESLGVSVKTLYNRLKQYGADGADC